MGCREVDTPCSSADRTSAWVLIGRSTLLVSPTSAQYPRSADMATTGECAVVNTCSLRPWSDVHSINFFESLVWRSWCKPDSGSSTAHTVSCPHPNCLLSSLSISFSKYRKKNPLWQHPH